MVHRVNLIRAKLARSFRGTTSGEAAAIVLFHLILVECKSSQSCYLKGRWKTTIETTADVPFHVNYILSFRLQCGYIIAVSALYSVNPYSLPAASSSKFKGYMKNVF